MLNSSSQTPLILVFTATMMVTHIQKLYDTWQMSMSMLSFPFPKMLFFTFIMNWIYLGTALYSVAALNRR